MDSTAAEITFDENGDCNFCTEFLARNSEFNQEMPPLNYKSNLNSLVSEIKENGKGKPYDCIIGLSGGLDSSWVLVQAVKLGLRPLAVHMDNGWNSELAQNNIECLINKLGVHLYTYVIDWAEYRDLQEAFFDADVVDIELIYDNALAEVNYMLARKYSLKYILSGSNTATEGITMPKEWAAKNKYDYLNIKNIWKKFGKNYRLKTFPGYGFEKHIMDYYFRKIRWVPFLDYFSYSKDEAISTLSNEYGFVPYPYKHYESIFTRFYQGYILPKKFGIDKRKNHLSALVLTNQLTREEGLILLSNSPYSNSVEVEDRDYVLKKFSWTIEHLNNYINRPGIAHEKYGSEDYKWQWKRKFSLYIKKFLF
jgi:N-acetyl sugar amidotransferase